MLAWLTCHALGMLSRVSIITHWAIPTLSIMPETLTSLIIGAVGGCVAAAIQYVARRYAESEQQRREIVETHLLQLQNSVESLYYRANNVKYWSGKSVMSDAYYQQTTAYALARVLAHESLLLSKGVYAKLRTDTSLKYSVKATLHALNRAMDDQSFLYYYRMQLGEMALDGDRIITYTEFVGRWSDVRFADAVASASRFVHSMTSDRLNNIRTTAQQLIELLSKHTDVPSALKLAQREPDHGEG